MKIKEVEEKLGIPRATVRFYEKQSLITPERKENEYREYSEEDVIRLQKILILRKLGFSVSEIEDLFDDNADLESLLSAQLENLEQQKKEINGAIEICRQMKESSVSMDSMDVQYYWDEIHEKEAEGLSFFDALSTEGQISLYQAASMIEYEPGHGPRTPDVIFNPLSSTTKKIGSFWERHSVMQLILVIIVLALSLAFVIFISNL